jgi:hypothetical protein
MMKLDEILRICLLAAASRYPGCLVEINQAVLDWAGLWKEVCTAEQALQRLESQVPQLLEAPARLLIDDRQVQSAIYLLDRSEEFPAFLLYCGKDHGEQLGRHMLHEPCLVLKEVD